MPSVLWLTDEQMVEAPVAAARAIGDFSGGPALGLARDARRLEAVVRDSRFDAMRRGAGFGSKVDAAGATRASPGFRALRRPVAVVFPAEFAAPPGLPNGMARCERRSPSTTPRHRPPSLTTRSL